MVQLNTREASYRRNISYHRAIKLTPCEAVYGIKPHHEKIPSTEESTQNQSEEEENCDQEGIEETPRKRQKITENQTKYNADMVEQTKQKQQKQKLKFKISDNMVAVKIDKVDKTNPLHLNMLLGKVLSIEETGCVQIPVVTKYGKITTLISPSRLCSCTATNVHLDYSSEISFTAACQKANGL